MVVTKQHKTPCSDCPWRQDAAPGWLGDQTPEQWVALAHGDHAIACHTRIANFFVQCAGVSIYRANVCKSPRTASWGVEPLRLKQDKEEVFASPVAFLNYHKKGP